MTTRMAPYIEPIEPRVLRILREQANGFRTVVEFGAGRFEKLEAVKAPRRIGIEICGEYIDHFRVRARFMEAIQGDIRDYQAYLAEIKALPFDLALFIDVIEHIDLAQGKSLLRKVQKDCRRIVVFAPRGPDEQTEDAWGFDNPWQRHLSTWWEDDFAGLGFDVEILKDFHGKSKDALLAIWDKPE